MDTDSKILFQFATTSFERFVELERFSGTNQIELEKNNTLIDIYRAILEKAPQLILKNNRNIPYFYFFYGKTLYYLNKNSENKELRENAIRLIKTALQNTPQNQAQSYIEYLVELINILISDGKSTEAINYIILMLQYKPNDKDYTTKLVELYKKTNKYEEAIQTLKKIMAIDAFDYEPCFEIGKIFLMQKKYDDAYKMFLRSKELEPKFPDNYKFIGKILLINNRKALAGSNFKTAIARKEYYHQQYLINLKTLGQSSSKVNQKDDERNTLLFIYEMYINLIKCGEDYIQALKSTEDKIKSKAYLSDEQLNLIKKRYSINL